MEKKGNNHDKGREDVGPELNPDDLDLREDNELTEEQYKNTNHEKQSNDSKQNNE